MLAHKKIRSENIKYEANVNINNVAGKQKKTILQKIKDLNAGSQVKIQEQNNCCSVTENSKEPAGEI